MPVELRKRKPTETVQAAPPTKKTTAKKDAKPAKPEATDKKADDSKAPEDDAPKKEVNPSKPIAEGDQLDLDGFGGSFGLTDGGEDAKKTLKELLDESKTGVAIFTYPKASTPGCTKQACLFRDNHADLTKTGFSIYGLSKDSIKANKNFKEKQTLPYELICDTSGELVKALGFHKAPSSTTRGVVAISKDGKVLIHTAGGPDATLEAVKPVLIEKAEKL